MPKRKPAKQIYLDAITFTLADAAAVSSLSVATLRRRAREGALRLVRVGGRTLVVADSLRRLLAGNPA